MLFQFDVTWDLYALTSECLLGLLPQEFDKFIPEPVPAAEPATELAAAGA